MAFFFFVCQMLGLVEDKIFSEPKEIDQFSGHTYA